MAYNYNNYHYWKGSFKGLLPNDILNLSNKDFNILLEEFNDAGIQGIGDKKYILNSSRKRIPILKHYFIDILEDFEYKENEAIVLFRSITVDNKEEINLSEKGICWTPVVTTLPYIEKAVLQNFGMSLKKYIVRFSGHTSVENIDWIESLFLYINYNKAERELRVYDSLKVVLDGYLCIDSRTKNIYSSDIEDINSIISKFLEFNPVTKRYDSKNTSSYFFIMNKEILLYLIKDGKFSIPLGKIDGVFDCSYLGLTSLEGAPTEVSRDFNCSHNKLTSLEGAPQIVGRNFDCSFNNLTSLEGAPKIVGGDFWCNHNPNLNSLEGIGEVKGNIYKDF